MNGQPLTSVVPSLECTLDPPACSVMNATSSWDLARWPNLVRQEPSSRFRNGCSNCPSRSAEAVHLGHCACPLLGITSSAGGNMSERGDREDRNRDGDDGA
jgi:hypothetical protein